MKSRVTVPGVCDNAYFEALFDALLKEKGCILWFSGGNQISMTRHLSESFVAFAKGKPTIIWLFDATLLYWLFKASLVLIYDMSKYWWNLHTHWNTTQFSLHAALTSCLPDDELHFLAMGKLISAVFSFKHMCAFSVIRHLWCVSWVVWSPLTLSSRQIDLICNKIRSTIDQCGTFHMLQAIRITFTSVSGI